MKSRLKITHVVALSVLTGFSAIGTAQEPQKDKPEGQQRQRAESVSMTGCLSKATAADQYVLTDNTGSKTTVKAASGVAIEKHANHTVKLTGSRGADDTFVATGIEHVSATCEAQK
jgi:hypothetical protein